MELKPGYKQTEVGVIPDEWQVSTVGREFDVKLGKMLDAEKNVGDLKPYIGNRNVRWDSIDASELPLMRMSRSDMDRFRLKKGDLLACEGGEVGRSAIWDAPIEECYYQKALHRLRPLRGFDSRLMMGLLRLWSECGTLGNYVTQTSIAHLPREKFVDVPMPVPPQPEQTAIATVLSDVEALLSGLDKLIAKKRDLKQAAMQQLLTGKTRLPGFSGEWEAKRLGEYLKFLKNGTNSRAELDDAGSIKYLHYGDIHASRDAIWTIFGREMPYLSQVKADGLARLQNGDVVFADASEDLVGVAKSVEIFNVAGEQAVSGLHTIAVRFDKLILADGFKAYLQFIPNFRNHLLRLVAGTKVYSTNRAHIANCELALPNVKEQVAIAQVLSDMDTELAALEAQHEKTHLLKQAMMQELLTGKTRLV